jgi:hypothetical protein
VLALTAAAFRAPRGTAPAPVPDDAASDAASADETASRAAEGAAPNPWVVFAAALAAGALFFLAKYLTLWPGVAAMLVALAGIGVAIAVWSGRPGWGGRHRFAAAAGGLLTYAWHSFTTTPLVGGGPVITPLSHALFALAAVGLLLAEARHLRRREAVPALVSMERPARSASDG